MLSVKNVRPVKICSLIDVLDMRSKISFYPYFLYLLTDLG